MIIHVAPGREIVVSSDLGQIRLTLWANKGSLGLQLDRKSAIRLRNALYQAILDTETRG